MPIPAIPDAFFRAIVESTSDAIITKDTHGTITSWNQGAVETFGFSAEEAIGQPITLLYPPDLVSEAPAILARILAGKKIDHYETVRRHKDGRLLKVSLTVSPVRDDNGQIVGACKIVRDITAQTTERNRAELVNQRLAAIVESSDDAIVSKHLDGTVTSWNAGAEKLFGYTAAEMVGQSILQVIPVDRKNEEQQIIARLQRGERVDHFETIRRRKDGSLIEVSLTISPILDVHGKIVGASKIARDVTALREAERRLRAHSAELEKLVCERTAVLQTTIAELEAFSYSLSHDMRAPLRAIQSYTEIVLKEAGGRIPEHTLFLQRTIDASRRLDRLIQDVLAFSRISRMEITLHPIDPVHIVREIIAERVELHAPDVTVVVSEVMPPLLGHEASLIQCLSNFLDNAVKFVRPGTKPYVEVFAEQRGANVRICVRDNGIGIDQLGQQRLFALFNRVATSHRYPGTGIGLAIVRKAAERMKGSVGVDSVPTQGSTFWVELPKVP